jgi:hypothetical protein
MPVFGVVRFTSPLANLTAVAPSVHVNKQYDCQSARCDSCDCVWRAVFESYNYMTVTITNGHIRSDWPNYAKALVSVTIHYISYLYHAVLDLSICM